MIGNFFYAWQAQQLSARTGRRDVTALPYGINTVSLFAFVMLVMLPVKLAALGQGMSEADAARVAWQIGIAACFVSALIELAGSLVASRSAATRRARRCCRRSPASRSASSRWTSRSRPSRHRWSRSCRSA